MALFDKAHQNADALRRVGERALSDARKAGVPACYIDAAHMNDHIREFPDGRRERISRDQDGAIIAIPPRPCGSPF